MSSKLVNLQLAVSRAQGSRTISPNDMLAWIELKNARANHFSLPYHGAIIYSEQAHYLYLPDPSSVQLLIGKITAMVESGISQRTQILFYYNISSGHAELLDVAFDAGNNKLSLVNVSSSHLASQHYFHKALIEYLKKMTSAFEIIACQANMQRDGISCYLYAYALSGIVAKLPFQQLSADRFRIMPPTLYDVSHAKNGRVLGPLENVTWCSIHALGNKAALMSQSFTFMRDTLSVIHSPRAAATLIEQFMAKFGLIDSADLSKKRTYIDYLYQRLCLADPAQVLAIDKLQMKCKVKDNGQLMRRAVSYCTRTEFDFLIDQFSKLALDNNPLDEKDTNPEKGFTPLLLALTTRSTPGRAIALIESGKVSADKQDAQGQSAKAAFAALPSDSQLAQNQKLQRYLK